MLRGISSTLVLIFVLSACALGPNKSNSDANPTFAPQPTYPNDPSSTDSPIVPLDDLPIPAVSDLTGELWVRRHWDENILLVYDLNFPEPMLFEIPEECEWPSGSDYFMCEEDGTYLYFPKTSEQLVLSPSKVEWISISTNSRWLTFPHQETDKIFSYDLTSNTVTEIQHSDFAQIYITLPQMSYDGKFVAWEYFVAGEGTYLAILDRESNTTQTMEIEPPLGGDLSWSPVENVLIYGEYLGNSDVGETANQVSIFYPEDGQTYIILAKSELLHFFGYGRRIWSPDGTEIALSSGTRLCILKVLIGAADCRSFEDHNNILEPRWSPDGENLVFHYQSPTIEGALMIFTPSTGALDVFLDEIRPIVSQFDLKE